MRKKPLKRKASVQPKASGRRSDRSGSTAAKKTAKANRSVEKKASKTAKRSGKKRVSSTRAMAKKAVKTVKSPAKKTVKRSRSSATKTVKSAKRPAKKTSRNVKATAKTTTKAAKRPIKKTSRTAKSRGKKASGTAQSSVKKTLKTTKSPARQTSKAAKSTAKKSTRAATAPVRTKAKSAKRSAKTQIRSTKSSVKKTAKSIQSTAKKAGKTTKSATKKTAKTTKAKARKTHKSASALKPAAVKKGTAAKSSEKALVKFDPLQRYLTEISTYKLLTREEERELGIRVREKGDKDAAYRLVTSNLRLVVKIALEFQRVWMQNLLDLIQEGNIGLMQAVKKFDPYKNVKFSYYASFWIKAYILKFIMDNWRLVKIGTTQGQRKLFFKLKKEKQKLIDEGFEPKPKLLSERLGVSEREIIDMDQRLDGWDVSLDAPLKEDSDTERIEFVSTDAESIEDKVSKKEIEVLLHNKIAAFRKKMTPRELEIFDLRIFSDNPVTLQEIGDRYGISRERVRQVEKNIIKKMREFFKREIPDFASYTEGSRAD
jgi:RNA polymerase sigma-32 factor